MRRAAELGSQIEAGLLLLWEDPGYVPLVSPGIVLHPMRRLSFM